MIVADAGFGNLAQCVARRIGDGTAQLEVCTSELTEDGRSFHRPGLAHSAR